MKPFQSLVRASAAKLAGCVLLAASFSSVALADPWDKKTYISFSAPVEIPGQVLAAGKYTFRLVDSPSNRYIVQISNERQDHVFATILAIPSYRMKAPDQTLITFYEAPSGQPQPVKAWFYPGDNTGREFIYPKSRGVLLSTLTPTDTSNPKLVASAAAPAEPVARAEAPDTEEAQAAVTAQNQAPAPLATDVDETSATAVNDESRMADAIAEENAPAAVEPAQEPQDRKSVV